MKKLFCAFLFTLFALLGMLGTYGCGKDRVLPEGNAQTDSSDTGILGSDEPFDLPDGDFSAEQHQSVPSNDINKPAFDGANMIP